MAPPNVISAPPPETGPATAAASRRPIRFAAGIIVAAAAGVYWNSLGCPFIFDDQPTIVSNPSIRHLWPLGSVLWPPANSGGASGRPLMNLTLALNYAAGGLDVQGYHAVNILLHALVALVLFGVVRRTLAGLGRPPTEAIGASGIAGRGRPPSPGGYGGTGRTPPEDFQSVAWLLSRPAAARYGDAALQRESLPFAFTAALLWAVHPLLTESVTVAVNRAELLAALFYLLTLYGFIRAAESRHSAIWYGLSIVACALGMVSKEWAVSAPLLVLLYDRTFVAGTFRGAWERRRWWYRALAGTWIVLAVVMLASNHRNETVGFGLGVSARSYALTQCFALVRYLHLAVWPHPQVLDYGRYLVTDPLAVAPQALLLAVLLAATGWALWRRPAAGFLGAGFFALLAPSSSVVPLVTQTVAEHRMYLPLAAVVVGGVAAAHALAGRRGLLALLALGVGFGALTVRRNRDYRTEFAVWSDVVAKWPDNARAQARLGILLSERGQVEAALPHYRTALRLEPGNPEILDSLGHALYRLRRLPEAIDCYEQALRSRPNFPEVHNNLGLALAESGRLSDAMAHYEAAIRQKPDYDKPRNNLGIAWLQLGRPDRAEAQFEAAVGLNPDFADAQMNLGNVLLQAGRPAEAIAHYEQAIRADPTLADAHVNLAIALAGQRRLREAITQCEIALGLQPGNGQARRLLAELRAGAGGP